MDQFAAMESVNSSFTMSLKFALLPIAKVLVMCGIGCLMATRYIGILSPSGIKLLSKLVFALFLPCLIFTELGTAVTFQKLCQWWFIPVNVLLAAVVGCSIGCLVVLIIRPPQEFIKFTIVMIGIGNIGNIPLVLIAAVCGDDRNPFGDSATCNELGVAYISFGQWVGAVIVYTFVFNMLSPKTDLDCGTATSDLEIHSTVSATVPLLGTEESAGGPGSLPQQTASWKTKMSRLAQFLQVKRLKHIFQPAVVASILALIIGAIPSLKNFFLTDDAPLYFLSDSLSIMGEAMIPCIMLALGGNLLGGPGKSKLGMRTTVAITFVRLFVVPPAGMAVVFLADKLGFLPENDQLFRFVLLLQHSMPSSILAGAVAALTGVAEKEASAVLFWEHILAIFSITGWLILYLNVFF